jgi:hypothetical protein
MPPVCANPYKCTGRKPPPGHFTTILDPSSHSEMTIVKLGSISGLEYLPPTSFEADGLHLYQNYCRVWLTPESFSRICTSFPNLKSLHLVSPDPTFFYEMENTPSSVYVPENLTSLTLENATMDEVGLRHFLDMFPKLENLKLCKPTIEKPSWGRSPSSTSSFNGQVKLTLSEIQDLSNKTSTIALFLNPSFSVEFRAVCLENCEFSQPQAQELQKLFGKWEATVKKIEISDVKFLDSRGSCNRRSRVFEILRFQR